MITNKADSDPVAGWLEISLFKPGLSTRPARCAKEMYLSTGQVSVDAVALATFPDPADRKVRTDLAREAAARARARAAQSDLHLLALADPRYPPLLREIVDPPPVLWVSGNVATLSDVGVGVVGSRDATPASLAVARKLGKDLSEAGVVVTSGLARGVDASAHFGALAGSGQTIAVLGSGLDVVYPRQHKLLAERIASRGAVISELPPWFQPVPRNFPLRNRILSGLSKAVVIVEASEGSGSLITARMANEQGRDVLAVPGGILSGRHRGSHALIKDGAKLVETVNDVLEEIGWRTHGPAWQQDSWNPLEVNTLEAKMAVGEPYTIEDLVERLGRPGAEILADLSVLELNGQLARLPGGQFIRMCADDQRRRHEG